MAILKKGVFQMTGSFANATMYRMHGSDKVIIRSKGGPSKKKIKTSPKCKVVRENNSEWVGCTRMGSLIRASFEIMHRVEDYAVVGALNAVCKKIQKLDTENEQGKRSILLSQHKEVLSGFSFGKNQVFESVLHVPVETSINRETGKAYISISAVDTGMYLYNFRNLPYYRIIANLSGACDWMVYLDGKKYIYKSPFTGYCDKILGSFQSEWMQTVGIQPALDITLEYPLDDFPIPDQVTLLLCVGIEFGKMVEGKLISGVKYAGTGKIIRVG